MNWKKLVLLSGVFVILCPGVMHGAAEALDYELRFDRPNTHLLEITIRAGGLKGSAVEFALPAWAPGNYGINDYAKNVQNFEARAADGRVLPWRKTDKQTWRVELGDAAGVRIAYKLYANTMANSWAQYNERHAFLGGPAVWMYLVGGKERPVRLVIATPQGWRAATGLERTGENTFSAADYDWLADCPIELSDWTEKTFTFAGTTYHFVVHDGMGKKDYAQVAADTQRIV
jgi:predicted metalloprotease with PDZ domain